MSTKPQEDWETWFSDRDFLPLVKQLFETPGPTRLFSPRYDTGVTARTSVEFTERGNVFQHAKLTTQYRAERRKQGYYIVECLIFSAPGHLYAKRVDRLEKNATARDIACALADAEEDACTYVDVINSIAI